MLRLSFHGIHTHACAHAHTTRPPLSHKYIRNQQSKTSQSRPPSFIFTTDQYDPNESMVNVVDDVVDELSNFPAIARDIQNRAKHRIGSGLTEARLFCVFFGTSVRIVEILWNLIIQGDHLPDDRRPEHLMWCLHFLKVYLKQGPECATISGSERGAVNPRTHRKWVWKFIEAVAELVDIVARIFVFFSYCVAIIVVEMHVIVNGDVYHRRPRRLRLILMTLSPPTSHKNITRRTTSPPNHRLTLTAYRHP
jgi:hypothetical protein